MSVSQVTAVTVRTKGKMSVGQMFFDPNKWSQKGEKQIIGVSIIITFLT
jgi:hypothetical protein